MKTGFSFLVNYPFKD